MSSKIVDKIKDKYNLSFNYVEIDKKNNIIDCFFSSNKLISLNSFNEIINILDTSINFEKNLKVKLIIKYDINTVYDLATFNEYYNHICNTLLTINPVFNKLLNYNIEIENRILKIYVEPEIEINNLEEMVEEFKKFSIDLNIETIIINEEIIEENPYEKYREDLEYLTNIVNHEEIVVKETKARKLSDNEITDIINIPVDQLGRDEYINEGGRPIFKIRGDIIDCSLEKKTKSYLFKAVVYDGTDSILCRLFVNERNLDKFEAFKKGSRVAITGLLEYDMFVRDMVLKIEEIKSLPALKSNRLKDNASIKRVELHAKTKMTGFDSIVDVSEYFELVKDLGHKAIAFTDLGNLNAYPDIHKYFSKSDIKPIYGVKYPYLNDDDFKVTFLENSFNLKDMVYTVFDIETTGFSINYDFIVEIGAVKIKNNEIIDKYTSLVKPLKLIPNALELKLGISNEMVRDARGIKEVLKEFINFSNNTCLVGHNVNFDIGHIIHACKNNNIEYNFTGIIDTMQIAKGFYGDDLKKVYLKAVASHFKVKLDKIDAHRASGDANATALIFMKMLNDFYNNGIYNYEDINKNINFDTMWKLSDTFVKRNVNLLVKNQVGYTNLFRLTSEVLTNYVYNGPKLLKQVLNKYREGLLIGSSCFSSMLIETAINKSYEDLLNLIDFYDYIEIQPLKGYLYYKDYLYDEFDKIMKEVILKIIKAAKEKNKIVVATGDVSYINKKDKMYYDILINVKQVGGNLHTLARSENIPDKHFLTTEEMLKEFKFLGEDLAYEIVVENTNKIADSIEKVVAFKKDLYAPKDDFLKEKLGINSVEEALKNLVHTNYKQRYGDNPHEIVKKRVDKELNSIISNKFSAVYYMSYLLVKKSLDDGYIVGSRGSVGSSLVATLMDITEINPLAPHYVCPKCYFQSFKLTIEEKKIYAIKDIEMKAQEYLDNVDSGFDLPDLECPCCGTRLKKDGQNIPFETFLGFSGDKIPDIDLNFAGSYQQKAHDYVRELLGVEKSFRSGTIGTVAEQTAFGHVKGYLEEKRLKKRKVEIERLSKKLVGIKRTTGQHPGGIIVIPDYIDVNEVTPIQYPADDLSADWRTTHFDYHSFEDNLLKLDILGHDDPAVLRFIMDEISKDPNNEFKSAKDIPVDDPKVYKLFNSVDVIGVRASDIDSDVASYAVPEFGTPFVRKLVYEIKPKNFADLVKISGISHGTDVWLNNARDLVLGTREYGTIEFKEVIGCRDDIMVYLIAKGLEPKKAFDIMEFVRRGKPSKDKEKWEEYKSYMREHNINEWYIWSCEQIKYMFPKAHASAYVLNAIRIAWFKIYNPIVFYSAYFSIRAAYFDLEPMIAGYDSIKKRIIEINNKYNGSGNSNVDYTQGAKKKDEDLVTILYVALEMYARGYSFKNVDIYKSDARYCVIDGKSLILPFVAITGIGEGVAREYVRKREDIKFNSIEEFQKTSKFNSTVIEYMKKIGIFYDMPEKIEEEEYNLFTFND